MTWTEMHEAIEGAQQTIRLADTFKQQMADLFAGQLRASNISHYTLRRLKKELQGYNMTTGLWKS